MHEDTEKKNHRGNANDLLLFITYYETEICSQSPKLSIDDVVIASYICELLGASERN
jgi:hypothetical protein